MTCAARKAKSMSPPFRLVVPALLTVVHSCRTSPHHVSAFVPEQPVQRRRRRVAGAPTSPSLVGVGAGALVAENSWHGDTALSRGSLLSSLVGASSCVVGKNRHLNHSTLSRHSTALSLARYDNLVSGLAEISIGFSLGVLWSEYAVLTTACGPINFSDTLERICYQGVILTAGLSLFTRIVNIGEQDLTTYVCDEYFGGTLAEATVLQVRAAEWLSILAVVGALVSLGFQIANGEQMDGLSGINTELCRAVRDL